MANWKSIYIVSIVFVQVLLLCVFVFASSAEFDKFKLDSCNAICLCKLVQIKFHCVNTID